MKIKKIITFDSKELKSIVKSIAYSPNHKMTIKIAKLVSLIGWTFTIISAVFLLLIIMSGGFFKAIILPFIVLVFLFSLLVATSGQVSIAIMNNANYSEQILIELQKLNKDNKE